MAKYMANMTEEILLLYKEQLLLKPVLESPAMLA